MKRHFWPNSNVDFAIGVGAVSEVVEGSQMPHPCPSSRGLLWLDIRAPVAPRCGKALQPPRGHACASQASAFHLPVMCQPEGLKIKIVFSVFQVAFKGKSNINLS